MRSSISEAAIHGATHLGIVALIPSLCLMSALFGIQSAPCTDTMGAIIFNGGGLCLTVLETFLVGVAICTYRYHTITLYNSASHVYSFPQEVATVLLRASARMCTLSRWATPPLSRAQRLTVQARRQLGKWVARSSGHEFRSHATARRALLSCRGKV